MRASWSLLLFALAWIATTPDRAHAAKKFSSPYVDLLAASAMAPAGERPSLVVGLANKTETAFWVRVRFQSPTGGAACDTARRVAAKGQVMLGCPQDTLLADTDYPFTVSVYMDSTLTRAQDENASTVRFKRGDLKAFAALTTAMKLPQTYEHVVCTEKLGLGAMMAPPMGGGSRLTVNPEGLEYESGNGTIKIAGSQVTAIKTASGGSFGPWVVVQYEVAGEKKLLGLRPSPTIGSASVENIRASLEQLFSSTRSK